MRVTRVNLLAGLGEAEYSDTYPGSQGGSASSGSSPWTFVPPYEAPPPAPGPAPAPGPGPAPMPWGGAGGGTYVTRPSQFVTGGGGYGTATAQPPPFYIPGQEIGAPSGPSTYRPPRQKRQPIYKQAPQMPVIYGPKFTRVTRQAQAPQPKIGIVDTYAESLKQKYPGASDADIQMQAALKRLEQQRVTGVSTTPSYFAQVRSQIELSRPAPIFDFPGVRSGEARMIAADIFAQPETAQDVAYRAAYVERAEAERAARGKVEDYFRQIGYPSAAQTDITKAAKAPVEEEESALSRIVMAAKKVAEIQAKTNIPVELTQGISQQIVADKNGLLHQVVDLDKYQINALGKDSPVKQAYDAAIKYVDGLEKFMKEMKKEVKSGSPSVETQHFISAAWTPYFMAAGLDSTLPGGGSRINGAERLAPIVKDYVDRQIASKGAEALAEHLGVSRSDTSEFISNAMRIMFGTPVPEIKEAAPKKATPEPVSWAQRQPEVPARKKSSWQVQQEEGYGG